MRDEMAPRRQELGEFIRAQRRMSRLSLRGLSEASGISNPYLSQIERGLRKPSADVLQHIAHALGMPVEPLYLRAGILEASSDGELVSHIRRDPTLSDAHKDALVRLYVQFRSEDAESDGAVGGEGEEAAPG